MITQLLRKCKIIKNLIKITKITVDDVRFPTSEDSTGSDAIHSDPDYSAAYVTIYTSENNLRGYGMTFTLGKGNDIVAACVKHFFPLFFGAKIHWNIHIFNPSCCKFVVFVKICSTIKHAIFF